tara:strand:+ start:183 stop:1271 length:1089 start_codon:yes stop_codon:yes gene_type:complete
MAYTTIDDPSAHFLTQLYTGDGSNQAVTNGGNSDLQPDLLWCTSRSNGYNRGMMDSTRGPTKEINSNQATTEATLSGGLASFDSDGFTFQGASYNTNSYTFVAWQWKAGGGSGNRTTYNESGANPGGGYQVNTTAGFSIVDYVGTGSNGGTVAHGLGKVPHWIMVKNRDTAQTWAVYHIKNTDNPETDILQLESTNATYDGNTYWNDTAPTSTNVTLGTSNDLNKDGDNIIMYAWTAIQGFSKFGKYKGNSSANGPFIYCGFKPAWVMVKRSDSSNDWRMHDNKRTTATISGRNPINRRLLAHTNSAEHTADGSETEMDLLSNGFKINSTSAGLNNSSGTYVYMAFAESPFVTSGGTPTHAK